MSTLPNDKFRYELKYLLNSNYAEILRYRLSLLMDKDDNGIGGAYFIRSLYFDDIHDTAYYEKIDGLNEREKYRIRYYNYDKSYIVLELKGKINNFTYKRQDRITEEEYHQIIDKNYDTINTDNRKVLREFINKSKRNNLIPSIIVDYNRHAYTYPVEDVRITFDEDISSGRYDYDLFNTKLLPYEVIKHDEVILEVKFNNYIPSVIRDILDTVPKTRIAISKFALCREEREI